MYAEEAVRNANNIRGALAVLATLHLTSYKYPLSANVTDGATYDYIVVGAGAAGSVVANRLTEDPNVSVLLIEAGGDPPIESNLPGLLGYCTKSYLDWNHKSQVDREAFKCHRNSQLHLSHGKVLGGTSSINYMFYTRGDPNDYNTWAKLTGDESWNYSNVLPYFKKSERFEGNFTDNPHFEIFHGTDGYLGVTKLSHEIKYSSSLKELGYNDDLDTNSNYTLGFSQQTLTLANGKRQGTAEAFLSNIKERKNLHIMKESLVTKIILDEHKVAIGVNVQSKEQKITVKANKEVILSAGAINSPQLLMLSGIGPKDELRKANIKLVADLPVGEKLQSHTAIVLVIKMEKSTSKLRSFSPYDYPFAATAGFVSINASQTYPDYQVVLLSSNADGVLSFLSDTQMFHNDIGEHFYQETKDSDAILITLYNSDPKSRGHITLRSSNPEDSPFVYINPFPDDDDLRKHIRYIEDMARLVDTTYFKSVGAELVHLPQCGDPVKGRDENYWKCYLQCLSTTAFHYVGTCPMTAVVDSRLRVYDVRNLRVVDASIMPTITSGNTMVPAIMIGEKAADMIKEDNCRR